MNKESSRRDTEYSQKIANIGTDDEISSKWSSQLSTKELPRMYNFRPSRGLVERRIGNAQPDSVFNVFDVQQFYLAIDISNLAFLSSTCSVYFMRPQIRRPAALEVSRKGEKYESDGVKRLPPETNLRINRESSRDFNKLRLLSFIIAFDRVFFFFFLPRSAAEYLSLRRDRVDFATS